MRPLQQEALASPQYKRLIGFLSEPISAMELRGFSNVLNSLAHLTPDGGTVPCDPAILDRMLLRVRAELDVGGGAAASEQSLSNIAWAIASMGIATDSAKVSWTR